MMFKWRLKLINGQALKAIKENAVLHYHQGASMKYMGEVFFKQTILN